MPIHFLFDLTQLQLALPTHTSLREKVSSQAISALCSHEIWVQLLQVIFCLSGQCISYIFLHSGDDSQSYKDPDGSWRLSMCRCQKLCGAGLVGAQYKTMVICALFFWTQHSFLHSTPSNTYFVKAQLCCPPCAPFPKNVVPLQLRTPSMSLCNARISNTYVHMHIPRIDPSFRTSC